MALRQPVKRWQPGLWASWVPFGIGEQRPNNYWEVLRAAWENRGRLGYAWRILREGCCDGCALGTAGLRDWTAPGIHLCNVRLRLLRLNTMPAFDPAVVRDVRHFAGRQAAELRQLGRLPTPLYRRRGEPGFRPLSWDEALELAARRIRASSPERLAFYLTSRGIPNETYYLVQKAARAIGTNNIDNAARLCHAPSTLALKETLGVAATTCSYVDLIGTDLVVFFGSNVAVNQPVMMKYLYYARKAGTRVALVNPYREPAMERYWVPSIPESALFGTRIADAFFPVLPGGDIGFILGTIKWLSEHDGIRWEFVERHTTGFAELRESLDRTSWEELERSAGLGREEMAAFGRTLLEAERAVFVWSMGVTQHTFGEDVVRTIVDLALVRGYVGREGCGLMPIRGHSGVQGGAEMGAYATTFPGGLPVNRENAARLAELWGFPVPDVPGLTAPEMVAAAERGAIDLLWSIGGNFMEVLPEPERVRRALESVPLRVHQDIILTPQMLIPADEVLLLPATTRYEIPGGVTETTTERRVIFSPEVPGPRVRDARPEGEVLIELAARVRPELGGRLRYRDLQEVREEIARAIPAYDGIQHLRKRGDSFQYGGRLLCAGGHFPTPDGRARFSLVPLPERRVPPGALRLVTRRGKQFNSMVLAQQDGATGLRRDDALFSPQDARALGLRDGQRVRLRNAHGELEVRVRVGPVKEGSVQAHWPEANVLLGSEGSPRSRIPAYKDAYVFVEPLE